MTISMSLHGKTEHDEILVDIDVSAYSDELEIDGFHVTECVGGEELSSEEVFALYEDEIWNYVFGKFS